MHAHTHTPLHHSTVDRLLATLRPLHNATAPAPSQPPEARLALRRAQQAARFIQDAETAVAATLARTPAPTILLLLGPSVHQAREIYAFVLDASMHAAPLAAPENLEPSAMDRAVKQCTRLVVTHFTSDQPLGITRWHLMLHAPSTLASHPLFRARTSLDPLRVNQRRASLHHLHLDLYSSSPTVLRSQRRVTLGATPDTSNASAPRALHLARTPSSSTPAATKLAVFHDDQAAEPVSSPCCCWLQLVTSASGLDALPVLPSPRISP